MHELGVVFYVIEECEKVAQENKVNHINSVTIQLGTVSGVIDKYLVDCWDWAISKHDIMTNCKLKIEKIKAITHCEDCGEDYNTIIYGKTCPHCKSENTYLLQGNEFYIKEMEAE